jgi:hypothetical protein
VRQFRRMLGWILNIYRVDTNYGHLHKDTDNQVICPSKISLLYLLFSYIKFIVHHMNSDQNANLRYPLFSISFLPDTFNCANIPPCKLVINSINSSLVNSSNNSSDISLSILKLGLFDKSLP